MSRSFSQAIRFLVTTIYRLAPHAEYMTISEIGPISIMPENSTFEEAAPITEGAHYALCDLRAAKIGKGQRILINGASGGIGSAAIQLARYFGADVTAVCGTKNVELVKTLGASRVFDFMQEDFTKLDDSFDIVFDAVGKSSFGKCKKHTQKGWNLYVNRIRSAILESLSGSFHTVIWQ